jgi:surface polysaccharide O-acyltransferase-like enzyme
MIESKSRFQSHIHLFRAIAIVLIVFQHVVPALDWSKNEALGRIILGLSDESSILFVFIAGYLFQHLLVKYSFNAYFLQKLKNVLAPYLIWSVPAIVVFVVFAQREGVWTWFYDMPVWQQVGLFLLSGKHVSPYWFIPMIFLFYLVAPIFRYIDQRRQYLYLLIIPLCLLSVYIGRDGPTGPAQKAVYMLPIYMMGMWVSHYRVQFNRWMRYAWLPILLLAAWAYVGYVLWWTEPPAYAFIVKSSFALLLVFVLDQLQLRIHSVVSYIADASFGIYFVHSYLITGFKILYSYGTTGVFSLSGAGEPFSGSVSALVILVLLILVCSSGVVSLIRVIFGQKSKMVVGA